MVMEVCHTWGVLTRNPALIDTFYFPLIYPLSPAVQTSGL
jgi:hypothetical protein